MIRENDIIVLCSYCPSIKNGNEWNKLNRETIDSMQILYEASGKYMSHGICKECYKKEMGDLV